MRIETRIMMRSTSNHLLVTSDGPHVTCNGIMFPTVYTSCEDQRRQEPMSREFAGRALIVV